MLTDKEDKIIDKRRGTTEMSTPINSARPCSTRLSRGPGGGDLVVTANIGIDANAEQALWMREPDDGYVSISLGQERLTLDFYDLESVERLRELLGEAARLLRPELQTAT